jgi:hypothetical protein
MELIFGKGCLNIKKAGVYMNKRKTVSLALAFGLLIGGSPAYADGEQKTATAQAVSTVKMVLNSKTASVNGKELLLPVEPTLFGDTTMVPIRAVSEALGAEVKWFGDESAIVIQAGPYKLRLVIGGKTAIVNDRSEPLDQPAQIVNETTMVPLRFIAESLNQAVSFDTATGTITITAKQSEAPPKEEAPAKPPVQKNKLETIAMETLIGGNKLREVLNFPARLQSIVTDKDGNVYVLFSKDRLETSLALLQYDAKTKRAKVTLDSFDSRFNFSYTEPLGGKKEMSYGDIAPGVLYYDEQSGNVYLLANNTNATYNRTGQSLLKSNISSIVYRITPDIQMVTNASAGGMQPLQDNFLLAIEGKQFYFSDIVHSQIYTSAPGGEADPIASIDKSSGSVKLTATIKEGKIYYFDKISQTLTELEPSSGATRQVAKVNVESLRQATARDGIFYLSNYEQIYTLDTSGRLSPYVSLKEIQQPDENGQRTVVTNPNGSIMMTPIGESVPTVKEFGPFTVDAEGNILLWDQQQGGSIRKIRLFGTAVQP